MMVLATFLLGTDVLPPAIGKHYDNRGALMEVCTPLAPARPMYPVPTVSTAHRPHAASPPPPHTLNAPRPSCTAPVRHSGGCVGVVACAGELRDRQHCRWSPTHEPTDEPFALGFARDPDNSHAPRPLVHCTECKAQSIGGGLGHWGAGTPPTPSAASSFSCRPTPEFHLTTQHQLGEGGVPDHPSAPPEFC